MAELIGRERKALLDLNTNIVIKRGEMEPFPWWVKKKMYSK